MIGSIFHIISDACMTLCLFLGAGLILQNAKPLISTVCVPFFENAPHHDRLLRGRFSIIGLPPPADSSASGT